MYLKDTELITLLKIGKSVEQWIATINHESYVEIKWLRIDQEKNKNYSISYFEIFDDGNEDFMDVYEFEPINPDLPFGAITTFPDYEQALNYCYNQYKASSNRFINAGMIQQEYKLYLKQKEESK